MRQQARDFFYMLCILTILYLLYLSLLVHFSGNISVITVYYKDSPVMTIEREDIGNSTTRITGRSSTDHGIQPKMNTIDDIFESDDDFLHYITHRFENYSSWFQDGTDQLKPDADANGPILDFAIVGFAKCGTTTMEANLGNIAPMPIGDICTPTHNTVWYAYHKWPKEIKKKKNKKFNDTLLYRGTKCPGFVHDVRDFSRYLPRTTLIIGIRHPVLWLQSFWNMQARNHPETFDDKSPYDKIDRCKEGEWCSKGCPHGQLFCLGRGRFHVWIAQMGKTSLNPRERRLLAPDDVDGGERIRDHRIRNPIFVYEQSHLNNTYVWRELSRTLRYHHPRDATIKHSLYHGTRGHEPRSIDICDAAYDDLRAEIMPSAYEMSRWFCSYLVPLAMDENRPDVVIPRPKRFCSLVKGYANDPCGRLIRLKNGTYVLQ